ncbi:MAG: hypothetical protein WBI53_10970 [Paludibacter sp.]
MPELRLRRQKTIAPISCGIGITPFCCNRWFCHPIKGFPTESEFRHPEFPLPLLDCIVLSIRLTNQSSRTVIPSCFRRPGVPTPATKKTLLLFPVEPENLL